MGEDIIRVSGFFDPKRTVGSQLLAGDESLWQAPLLICVKHNRGLITRYLAKTLCTRQVMSERPSHLQFECAEACIETSSYFVFNLRCIVLIPPDAGVISWISAGYDTFSGRS